MKKIAVITTTRAEYGLLYPVIQELRKLESELLRVELIASGTHLSEHYGMTVNEIKERIDYKIEIPINSVSEEDVSSNQAETLIRFTRLFIKERYDAVILLGDRYETLAIAIAAGNTRTPIFHICGGDTTEGAMDEWIRHSITKISYLHFVTNEDSLRRVIQLGEDPSRVFNYGSTSIDNINNILTNTDISKTEVLKSIGLDDCRYAICTYHPVTIEGGSVDEQINSFFAAIRSYPEITFIVTKSNADQGGARINELLDKAEKTISNLHVFASLGMHKYILLMKYAEFVLGNSSSGIIEAPALRVPTVNIGDRQRGRLQSESVINCGPTKDEIVAGIKTANSYEHRIVCEKVKSPYGEGNAAKMISRKVVEVVLSDNINLKKKFYNIDFQGRHVT